MAATEALLAAAMSALLAEAIDLPDGEMVGDDAAFGLTPGWDSFSHIVLLDAVAKTFGVSIGFDAIDRSLTLADLIGLVAENGGGGGGRCPDFLSALVPGGLRVDDVVYVHSRWQGVAEMTGGVVALLDYLGGDGRTVMVPAFPFSSRDYPGFLDRRPAFAVDATPPATGLLPAALWRHPQALRSAHPILSECALGPKAAWLTGQAHTDPSPFHAGSTYARLLESDGVMVGLGVDIATNAIIHWADDVLAGQYDFPIYEAEPLDFDVTFADGTRQRVAVRAYHRTLPKRMRPRNLRPWLDQRPQICREAVIDGVPVYALRVRPFVELCLDLGRQALAQGRLPAWHEQQAEHG